MIKSEVYFFLRHTVVNWYKTGEEKTKIYTTADSDNARWNMYCIMKDVERRTVDAK